MEYPSAAQQRHTDARHALAKIAAGFVERSNSLGIRGKRRDDAAIHYLAGAAKSAEAKGDEVLVKMIATHLAMSVCFEGFKAVEKLQNVEEC